MPLFLCFMISLVVNRLLLLLLVDKWELAQAPMPRPKTLAATQVSAPGPTRAEAPGFLVRRQRAWRRRERNRSSFHHASASWQEASLGA